MNLITFFVFSDTSMHTYINRYLQRQRPERPYVLIQDGGCGDGDDDDEDDGGGGGFMGNHKVHVDVVDKRRKCLHDVISRRLTPQSR